MPFCDDYANNILKWLFGQSSSLTPTRHSVLYLGLSTNDPEADLGTFNELSCNTYERLLIVNNGSEVGNYIGDVSDRAVTNIKQINWTKATANWDKANGFGLFTAPTGGTPIFYGKLDLTPTQEAAGGLLIETGAVALFDPGALKISFSTTDISEAAATSE